MDELISLIIPIYKVEAYLERCITSVIAQTYHNLEIILVDDGSPDQCGVICERFARQDARIKVFHKANGGLSDARNYGVERSHGKYIAFIDSDDYVAPNYIAYLIELLIKYHADISCCCMVQTSGHISEYGANTVIPNEQLLTGKEACKELLGSMYHTMVTAWGKLYKSEIVKKYPFPVGKKHEDEATTCKYYYAANKVVVGNQCLYAYYQNPNSITHTNRDFINHDAIWALRHRAEFFGKQGEKLLAEVAWDRVFYYCIYDSLAHQGRCDAYLNELDCGKRLSRRAHFELKLYDLSPLAFQSYLKMIIYPLGKLRDKIKYIRKR